MLASASPEVLDLLCESLRRMGDLSSTIVRLILEETLARSAPQPGSDGLVSAMAAGLCSERVLLQW